MNARKKPLELVLIPMALAWQNPAENIRRMRVEIETWLAAHSGIDRSTLLFVFPELTLTGFTTESPANSAVTGDNPSVLDARKLASRFGVALAFGYPALMPSGRVRNTLELVEPSGTVVARYEKLHLYTAGKTPESTTYEPGEKPVLAEYRGWKIAFGICFDLRFPELFRVYHEAGTDLVLLPACWVGGPTKSDQFRSLARAHAILGQTFFAALSCGGNDPFASYAAETLCFGPRGETLVDGAGVATSTRLDPALLDSARMLAILPSVRSFADGC